MLVYSARMRVCSALVSLKLIFLPQSVRLESLLSVLLPAKFLLNLFFTPLSINQDGGGFDARWSILSALHFLFWRVNNVNQFRLIACVLTVETRQQSTFEVIIFFAFDALKAPQKNDSFGELLIAMII